MNMGGKQSYCLPQFLDGAVNRGSYVNWLQKKATAHAKRDRIRTGKHVAIAEYKRAIHKAVENSNGADWYTGEALQWSKISTYNNEQSKSGRSTYKSGLALLPTVDHVLNETGAYDFVICSWRTNDAKSDMPLSEFVSLCRRVIKLHGNSTNYDNK